MLRISSPGPSNDLSRGSRKPHSEANENYDNLTFALLRTEGCKSVLVDNGSRSARSRSSVFKVTQRCLRVFVPWWLVGCWKETR